MKWLLVCGLVLASGNALAMDPDDEDASYLPQQMLEEFFSAKLQHGFDKTYFKNCMAENPIEAKSKSEQRKIVDSCRIKATPRKCRELPSIPVLEQAKSAQETCATSCKQAGKEAGEGCALN